MYTLGHGFVPDSIHAGGLRYHGDSPLISKLVKEGYIEAVAVGQRVVFDAAVQFARTEGIIAAPESAHAIRVAVDEAEQAKREGKPRVILFGLSGHGHFDLSSYDDYFSGKLVDLDLPQSRIDAALADLPDIK